MDPSRVGLALLALSFGCSQSTVLFGPGGAGGSGGSGSVTGAGGSGGAQGCAACDDGNVCTVDGCTAGVCSHSALPTDDGNACTVDACDPAAGVSHKPVAIDDGNACTKDGCEPKGGVQHTPVVCDDKNPCTIDSCEPASGCKTKPAVYFSESFAAKDGWTQDTGWDIGPAMASSGQTNGFGTDPAEDHSPSGDNGIAGAFIGGNIPVNMTFPPRYLTSPVINLANVNGPVQLELWRVLNADSPPFMSTTIDAFDGAKWVTVFNLQQFTAENTAQMPGWKKFVYDVTGQAQKNATFRIRFGFAVQNSSGAFIVGGWNLDDIRLVPDAACP